MQTLECVELPRPVLGQTRRAFRHHLGLPLSEWLREIPRLAARTVSFLLPLWLTYSAQRSEIVTEQGQVGSAPIP